MITEASIRARSAELFSTTVDQIGQLNIRFEDVSSLFLQKQQLVSVSTQDFAGRGRLSRAWGHVLDKLRIVPIVPSFARNALQRATQDMDMLHGKLNQLLDDLSYYGRHLAGTHRFLGLHYNPFEQPATPYQVSFVIQTKVGAEVWEIRAQGEFSQLLYKSIAEQNPQFSIPRPSQEVPLLLLPRGDKMRIEYVGYAGPGEYDRFVGSALWEPKYTRTPKPIKPQEFVYEPRLALAELVLTLYSNPRG